MQRSINQIVDELRVWAAAHVMINDMAYGDIQAIVNAADDVTYPLMAVNCVNAPVRNDAVDVQLQIIFLDRVGDFQTGQGERKQHEVESDMLQVVNDLYQTIENSDRWKNWTSLQEASPAQKFVEYTGDRTTGWMVDMTLRVWKVQGTCDLPLLDYDYDQTTSPLCAPVKIFEDGELVETVPSGGEYSYESGGGSVYSLSIPQAPYLEDVIANTIILIQDEAGVDFSDPSVSLNIDGNTLEVRLADFTARWIYDGGFVPFSFSRISSLFVEPQDSDGNRFPEPVITQPGSGQLIATYTDIPITLNLSALLDLSRASTGQDIQLVDSNDDDITDVTIVGSKITVNELPCSGGGITVDVISSEIGDPAEVTTFVVGDTVRITVTAATANSFCIQLGNGESDAGTSNTCDHIYYLPNIYTIGALAGNVVTSGVSGSAGVIQKDDYLTINGLNDEYSDWAFGFAPLLLYRTYSGNWIFIERPTQADTDVDYLDTAVADVAAVTTYADGNDTFVQRAYGQASGASYFDRAGIAASAPQIADSGLVNRDGNLLPTLFFDGDNDYLSRAAFNYWTGADRTRISFYAVYTPRETPSNITNLILSHFDPGANQESWRLAHSRDTRTIRVDYSTGGSSATRQYFISDNDSLLFNETALIFVTIDTNLTTANRIKIWKTTALGTTLLTGSMTGNQSGNIHQSTADMGLGCQFNSGAVSSPCRGNITAFDWKGDDVPTAEREAIQAYWQGVFNNVTI